jgi:pimeloyl-ACP methyl ester carboxylesterase
VRLNVDDEWWLLHGTPLTPVVWDAVAAYLGAVGRVTQPVVAAPPGGDGRVTELAKRLVSGIPAKVRPHLVGHSFGGQVALEMALLAPDRIRSLTMVCSRDTPFPAFAGAAAALREGGPVDADAAMRRWFRPAELETGGAVVQYARRCLATAHRDSWADALEEIARFDRSHQTPDLEVPLVSIAAQLDQVSTVDAMRALAERAPTSTFHVIEDASHMSPFLAPAALARLLADMRPPS